MPASSIEFYYDEPRLKMTAAGRTLIRVVSSASYGLITAAAGTLTLSDVRGLRSTGFILILFLLSRLLKLGKPELDLQRIRSGRVNIAKCFTPSSYRLFEVAFDRSGPAPGDFFMNLFKALLARQEVKEAIQRMDVSGEEFSAAADKASAGGTNASEPAGKDVLIKEVAFLAGEAFSYAFRNQADSIGSLDIFAALAKVKDPRIVKIFQKFSIAADDFDHALIIGRFRRAFFRRRSLPAHKKRHRIMNRAWTARPTPVLDRFSEDLTDAARGGSIGFMLGHEREYDQLIDVLSRPGSPNAVLVGEPSSGKTTIVEHLAFEIARDKAPQPLFDRRLVKLSLGALAAGAAEGELEARVRKILDEIARAGNIILYIPDIHNLVKSGGPLRMSAADILIPAIKGAVFSVIGSTYPREYKQYIEKQEYIH